MNNTYHCSTCRHYRMIGDGSEGQCRGTPPFVGVGNRAVWPIVAASETACIRFNPFSTIRGRPTKISNEVILNTIYVATKPYLTTDEKRERREVHLPRAWLVKRMMKAGLSATPALARIKTLERRGLIESGERVWGGEKRICVWPTVTAIPEGVKAEVRESDDICWLRMIAGIATPEAPKSLRAMWRETQERTRESLATASRRLQKLTAAGFIGGGEGGYWVKAVPERAATEAKVEGLSEEDLELNWYNPYSKFDELPEDNDEPKKPGRRKVEVEAPEITLD